jgi:hypothetical protein
LKVAQKVFVFQNAMIFVINVLLLSFLLHALVAGGVQSIKEFDLLLEGTIKEWKT